ncbi:uncharacterized protein B0P05DRAFT_559305 [Gilbertella persicaria]|uniref:uncharacterized protein n=1 Tax=Gilbertella persicaria TaxID=101096 RepID=UPI00221E3D4E|nr:uncharacterized protein B0P05DRAFT_559305 [Gilbertella persicaria]KAI8058638.1 hypothetical protein B0P05DRAFT_559305 [Gilbertella persicaria]
MATLSTGKTTPSAKAARQSVEQVAHEFNMFRVLILKPNCPVQLFTSRMTLEKNVIFIVSILTAI